MPDADNAAAYFLDRHVDAGHADRMAFVEATPEGRSLSYGQLAENAARLGGALLARGVRREERVMMLVHDTLEFPTIFWGAIRTGIVPVPVNTLLAAPVYGEILADCRPSVLFVSAPLWETVRPALSAAPDTTA